MLPVTSRNIGLATTSLAYTANQYRQNLPIPNVYQMYRVYLAAFEAKIIRVRKESGLMLRQPETIYDHKGARANFLEDISRFNAFPLAVKMTVGGDSL